MADDVGILAVAVALPRARLSVDDLAARHGIDPTLIRAKLGLERKCVALAEDEHPADFATEAARAALAACGASAADVGLAIFSGVSRDRPPPWGVALDVVRRLDLRAFAYDLLLGCAGSLAAIEVARARPADGRPPLTLVMSAERWSDTLPAPEPEALIGLGYADGGAACVVGPGGARLLPPHAHLTAENNDRFIIPAGGTREPVTPQAIAEGRTRRVATTSGRSLLNATLTARDVLLTARAALPAGAEDVQLYTVTQMPLVAARGLCRAAAIPEERCVLTYAQLGHLGAADPLIGLAEAVNDRRLRAGTVLMLAATNTTTMVTPLLVSRPDAIAVPRA